MYGFKLSDEGIYNRHGILLQDLNDVDGFQTDPKQDVIYGFNFSDNGNIIDRK